MELRRLNLEKTRVFLMEGVDRKKVHDILTLINRRSAFDQGLQDTSFEALRFVQDGAKVLVVGAGGLGCETIKCLALSGFRDITVVDMDTIDVSNLNRQFLFRSSDIGKSKAVVAAEYVNRRCGHLGVNIKSKTCRIQDLDERFYSQFMIVIAGLDNIPARRWLNSMIYSFVRKREDGTVDPSSIKFLLDGGTEGFKGQARVIVPSMTACFECTVDTFPPVTTYPLCTIAETPRLPEHCIEYALTILFEKTFPARPFSADKEEDIEWVYQTALARAESFNIQGVTKQLTKGVVKRIIPAVASTNATIAAALVNEAFKIATYSNPIMSNYFMFMGQTGINVQTFAYERKPECLVCGDSSRLHEISISRASSLSVLIAKMVADLHLTAPSIACEGRVVFMQKPEALRQQLEFKLDMSLSQMWSELAGELIVTDPAVTGHIRVRLSFVDGSP